jgi:hypothetical protein
VPNELRQLKRKEILVILWLVLFLSTLATWASTRPSGYGASNTSLEADEIEVIWWNALTTSDETLVIRYEVELGSIDIYVVSQASYNRTSGELPTSYFLHHLGDSTELELTGPLPLLYFVVVSEVDQPIYQQAWTYSTAARFARALAYPITVFLIVITGVNLGWYWKKRC